MAAKKKGKAKKTSKKASKKAASKRSRSSIADRSLVSGKQKHEVAYLARKHKVSAAAVRETIKKVGNSRKKVDAALAGQ